MTYTQEETTVERGSAVVTEPIERPVAAPGAVPGHVVEQRYVTAYQPSGSTIAARVVVVLFGVVQALLLARIVLRALGALDSNVLVAAVLNITQVIVSPFEGMFRSNTVSSGASVIDTAAITALIAVTILDVIVLAIVRIPRRSERI